MPAWQLDIEGPVQGIGFRPFIYRLATSLSLKGWVTNTGQGVRVLIEGPEQTLSDFRQQVQNARTPPEVTRSDETTSILPPGNLPCRALAQSRLVWQEVPEQGSTSFRIKPKAPDEVALQGSVPPDTTICRACLEELFDPTNRRYRYPFIHCVDCGPRFSLIRQQPFERSNTTLAPFTLCDACESEYLNPEDRRFHAQTQICADCGPELRWYPGAHESREPINGEAALREAISALRKGGIIAIKGVGGFHLITNALQKPAVEALRSLKQRPHKPLALMVPNLASARLWQAGTPASESLLMGRDRPIVLAPAHPNPPMDLSRLNPGLRDIGLMLPYTALHWLLFEGLLFELQLTERALPDFSPRAVPIRDWLEAPHQVALVCTSANAPGEPISTTLEQCQKYWGKQLTGYLDYNREIAMPIEDAVIQSGSPPQVFRHGRGTSPLEIRLPLSSPSAILALGAYQKSTACLIQGDRALISPPIGDLGSLASLNALEQQALHLETLTGVKASQFVSDAHPDFPSTGLARRLAGERRGSLHCVWHHEAHLAAVLAEFPAFNTQPVLGLALDGFGLGPDQQWCGGELFYGQVGDWERLAFLEPLPLPGGERCTQEIWRLGLPDIERIPGNQALWGRVLKDSGHSTERLQTLIKWPRHPATSSLGRWFDRMAYLLGAAGTVSYEGQAAAELEAKAWRALNLHAGKQQPPPDASSAEAAVIAATVAPEGSPVVAANGELSLSHWVNTLSEIGDPDLAARAFHTGLAQGLLSWVEWALATHPVKTIVLAGGCFQNRLLRETLLTLLEQRGLSVLLPDKVPANDHAISLGQAWTVATLQLKGAR